MYAPRSSVTASWCETARAVTAAGAAMGLPSGGRAVGGAIGINYRVRPAAVSPGTSPAQAVPDQPTRRRGTSERWRRSAPAHLSGSGRRPRRSPAAGPSPGGACGRRRAGERAFASTIRRTPARSTSSRRAPPSRPAAMPHTPRIAQVREPRTWIGSIPSSRRMCRILTTRAPSPSSAGSMRSKAPNRALSATVRMTSSVVIGRPSTKQAELVDLLRASQEISLHCVPPAPLPRRARRRRRAPRTDRRSSAGDRGPGRGIPRSRRRRLRGP